MPYFNCPECGNDIIINQSRYNGEVACKNCATHVFIQCDSTKGFKITRMRFSLTELEPYWSHLDQIEQSRLNEAVFCSLYAPSACESMCFDALCSLLRRIYGEKKELGYYTRLMTQDPSLRRLSTAISYFYDRRNEIDHPERIANSLEAESTFLMTKRLIIGIINNKSDFFN